MICTFRRHGDERELCDSSKKRVKRSCRPIAATLRLKCSIVIAHDKTGDIRDRRQGRAGRERRRSTHAKHRYSTQATHRWPCFLQSCYRPIRGASGVAGRKNGVLLRIDFDQLLILRLPLVLTVKDES